MWLASLLPSAASRWLIGIAVTLFALGGSYIKGRIDQREESAQELTEAQLIWEKNRGKQQVRIQRVYVRSGTRQSDIKTDEQKVNDEINRNKNLPDSGFELERERLLTINRAWGIAGDRAVRPRDSVQK